MSWFGATRCRERWGKDRVKVERHTDPGPGSAIDRDRMKQPSGEEDALARRGSESDVSAGVMEFRHAVTEIGRQHARQATPRVIQL